MVCISVFPPSCSATLDACSGEFLPERPRRKSDVVALQIKQIKSHVWFTEDLVPHLTSLHTVLTITNVWFLVALPHSRLLGFYQWIWEGKGGGLVNCAQERRPLWHVYVKLYHSKDVYKNYGLQSDWGYLTVT